MAPFLADREDIPRYEHRQEQCSELSQWAQNDHALEEGVRADLTSSKGVRADDCSGHRVRGKEGPDISNF